MGKTEEQVKAEGTDYKVHKCPSRLPTRMHVPVAIRPPWHAGAERCSAPSPLHAAVLHGHQLS